MSKPAGTLPTNSEALQNSEDRYHKMIDEVQDYAIILLDNEGIIQNWNKGAQYIKQYTEAEAVGKSFRMFYLPEDRERHLPELLLEQAVRTGKALHEGWRVRKDQSKFWGSITLTALHDEKGMVIGFSKVTRDLTERKLAEDRLKASEERHQKMIAEIEDYAILLLDADGNIQNWNEGAQKIKGYAPEEAIGKNFQIFYTPEDRERQLPQHLLNEAIRNGKALHEGWRVRKDGSKFWGNTVITALHGADGTVIGFSKVTRNLTERKQAEDQMQVYVSELKQQNEELQQFAYVASHDLQEPLRKIRMFIDVAGKNLHQEDLLRKYFERINVAAERMSQLIQSVLNYSRFVREPDAFVPTDLNAVLAAILNDFELLIEEKQATIVSDPLPTIAAIPLQVHQLLANLVGNALKFTVRAPVISITSKVVGRADILPDLAPHLQEGSYLELVVADNGIGFDEQYEQLIFGMFQRLHAREQYSGTGIGLALCKKIMDNHGGHIAAKSSPGNGARFYVYFPYAMTQLT